MSCDSDEGYVTCADCVESEGEHEICTAKGSLLRVDGVLNCLRSLGISAVCLGDGNTIVLTHRLQEALSKLVCDLHGSAHLLWIRRVEVKGGRGFCSIEPLTSSETCGLTSASLCLRCDLCKKCLVAPSPVSNPFTSHKGFALAGVACLLTFHPEAPLPPSCLRSYIVFCLSAISKGFMQMPLGGTSEESALILGTYISGLEQHCGDSDLCLPQSGACVSETNSVITPALLCMLECVSKESLDTSLDEFKDLQDRCVGVSREQIYPGFIGKLETELERMRTYGAVLAVSFDDASDFCLYEMNFTCALNYLSR